MIVAIVIALGLYRLLQNHSVTEPSLFAYALRTGLFHFDRSVPARGIPEDKLAIRHRVIMTPGHSAWHGAVFFQHRG